MPSCDVVMSTKKEKKGSRGGRGTKKGRARERYKRAKMQLKRGRGSQGGREQCESLSVSKNRVHGWPALIIS